MKKINIETYKNLLRKSKQYCEEYNYTQYIYFKMFYYCFSQIFKQTKKIKQKSKNNILKINIATSGGIGDIIYRSIWIKEFTKGLKDNFEITLHILDKSKINVSKSIFYKNSYISKVVHSDDYTCNCDLAILVDNFPSIKFADMEKISDYSKDLANLLQTYMNFESEHFEFINDDISTYYVRLMLYAENNNKKLAQILDINNLLGITPNTNANICINPEYFNILEATNLYNKKYITFVYDVDCRSTLNNNVRLWSLESYEELIKLIKQKYPAIQTVQIGTQRSPLIQGIDIDLRGKTNFEELKIILKNSILHIDGECGMVHLKHYLNGTSAVLFGQTSISVKGYDNNINIKSEACPHWCEWIVSNWQTHCIRGFAEPPCLKEIKPEFVFNKIETYLDNEINKSSKEIYYRDYDKLDKIINSKIIIFGKEFAEIANSLNKNNDIVIYDYEFDFSFIKYCKENHLKFEYADIYNIPSENNTFDYFIGKNLDVYQNKGFAQKEISRILRDKGSILSIE